MVYATLYTRIKHPGSLHAGQFACPASKLMKRMTCLRPASTHFVLMATALPRSLSAWEDNSHAGPIHYVVTLRSALQLHLRVAVVRPYMGASRQIKNFNDLPGSQACRQMLAKESNFHTRQAQDKKLIQACFNSHVLSYTHVIQRSWLNQSCLPLGDEQRNRSYAVKSRTNSGARAYSWRAAR